MITLIMEPTLASELRKVAEFEAILTAEFEAAGIAASELLVVSAQGNMHWQNSTGALQSSIQAVQTSPYAFEIGSFLPYAQRREFGFTGMTDSLGRFYAYDPGAFYMTDALNENQDEIEMIYLVAVEKALAVLAGRV